MEVSQIKGVECGLTLDEILDFIRKQILLLFFQWIELIAKPPRAQ
jgi:hypothetical protein